jgi:hypothetical protein
VEGPEFDPSTAKSEQNKTIPTQTTKKPQARPNKNFVDDNMREANFL